MNRLKFVLLMALLAFFLSDAALGAPHPPQEPNQPVQATAPAGDKDKANTQAPPGFDFQKMIRDFMATGEPPDPEAVKRGQTIFVPTCGFCHGSTGRGGSGGPTLVRSVLVLHDKGTGKEIFPVVHNGRISKGMPAFSALKEDQVKDISAYLLSLVQATANRNEYKILNIITGDAGKGETYFKAHCASCHSPTGDLAHIANKYEPVVLQTRFLYPKTPDFMPGAADPRERSKATVKLASGQTYSGILDKIDDFSISLTDSSGAHHSWEFEAEPGISYEIDDPLKGHRDLLRKYSDDDMHNILTYLETLK